MKRLIHACVAWAISAVFVAPIALIAEPLALKGVTVVPHLQSSEMLYRQPADFSLGARVQVYVMNSGDETVTLDADTPIMLRGESPDTLLGSGQWTWHDYPGAWPERPLKLPPGAMTVWSFNGKNEGWGAGTHTDLIIQNGGETAELSVPILDPAVYLSSVTFLGDEENPYPDSFVFYIRNNSDSDLTLKSCRLWLPESNETWRALQPQEWLNLETFAEDGVIPAGDSGGARVKTGSLPLTYTSLEARLEDAEGETLTLWAHLRIKREAFDISGGWVGGGVNGRSALTYEPYLKTLKRMHINTGHIADTGGYTDNPDLYGRYPLKYFNKLEDTKRFSSDELLPRVHAVEFLGEPQYGGGTPVPPMDVWRALAPYQPTRLPTTVTHSEERIWRDYSGLSDYPHYDAYRVTAPSADFWRLYDRWGGERIRWGAPLETIGDMTRSLRELNRPMAIAYWSQGAHSGWDGYGGRERTSPTPDELRAQAYHALAARITSLYWFNLSLKSLLAFPDLIQPITEVGREMKMLENFYLEGNAYHYRRVNENGAPSWDLYVIESPRGAALFALDLAYEANLEDKVFEYGPPREARFEFELPGYLRKPAHVIQVSANEVDAVDFESTESGIAIAGEFGPDAIFIATHDDSLADELEVIRLELIEYEESLGFDPGNNDEDYKTLRDILGDS